VVAVVLDLESSPAASYTGVRVNSVPATASEYPKLAVTMGCRSDPLTAMTADR
jgi:hypothetical protein